jgi:hypothetical protein
LEKESKKTEAETALLIVQSKVAILLKHKELIDAGVSRDEVEMMFPLNSIYP